MTTFWLISGKWPKDFDLMGQLLLISVQSWQGRLLCIKLEQNIKAGGNICLTDVSRAESQGYQ